MCEIETQSQARIAELMQIEARINKIEGEN